MKTITNLLLLAALVWAASCTVKEDRDGCPCMVSVKTETSDNGVTGFYEYGSLAERKVLDSESLTTGNNRTQVRKGGNCVSVVIGCDDMDFTAGDTTVRCTYGKECGELYGFADAFDACGDEMTVEDVLHKQYSKIDFTFVHPDGRCPYDVTLLAACNGINLTDMKGVRGSFAVELAIDSLNRGSVRVPRQSGYEDVRLRLSRDGKEEDVINLSNWFLAAAYSWDTEDLEDIAVTVDFASMTVTFRVAGWQVRKSIEIEI